MNLPTDDIVKFLDGSLSYDRTEEIQEWRNETPENETYFQELSYIWKLSNQSLTQEKDMLVIDTEAALKNVSQKIDSTPVVQLKPRRQFLAIACGLIALICTAFLLKPFLIKSPDMILIASNENNEKVELPDGSIAYLEPFSELSYSSTFADQRDIKASGEIYFDVERDPTKPFIIQTPKLNVKVLGTSFVILDEPDDDEASVTVISGKVHVEDKLKNKSIILTKEMTGMYSSPTNDLTIQKIPRNINHLHHITQYVSFYNNNLKDVKSELEKISDFKITMQNPALNSCLFTGQFKTNNVEDILKSIQPIYNFNMHLKGNEYIITNGYCKK